MEHRMLVFDRQTDVPEWGELPHLTVDNYPWYAGGRRQSTMMQICLAAGEIRWRAVASDVHSSAAAGRQTNGDVYLDSCVEMFLQLDDGEEEEEEYVNVEVNCCGVLHVGRGRGRSERQLCPPELLSRVRVRSSIVGDGKAPAPDTDSSWSVELALPVADVLEPFLGRPVRCSGERGWRANFYRCGGAVDAQYACWSPIDGLAEPNFHVPRCFGRLRPVAAVGSLAGHCAAPLGTRRAAPAQRRAQLVCLGDSLTQFASAPDGFVSMLSCHYGRRLDVLNRGYSGYTTDMLLTVVGQHVSHGVWPPAAAATVLCIGANDRCLPGSPQHVPLARFADNLERLVDLLLSACPALLLVTPPQVDPLRWARARQLQQRSQTLVVSHDWHVAAQYADAVRQLAARRALPLVDLWALTPLDALDGDCLSDGLHLSVVGNLRLFLALRDAISANFPQLRTNKLPLDAPLYDDFLVTSSFN